LSVGAPMDGTSGTAAAMEAAVRELRGAEA
jgi:hypothetical protein